MDAPRYAMALRLVVFIALAALCTRCAPEMSEDAGAPRPLPPTFFGLDLQYDHVTGLGTPWPDDAGFSGHQVVRLWLADGGLWADVHAAGRGEPMDWSSVDAYVNKARGYPQEVVYVIAMTPSFAVAPERRSTKCAWPWLYPGGCNPPDDWDDAEQGACLPPADAYRGPNCTFKEYLVALARRYRSIGTQAGCPDSDPQCRGVIHHYELWNEVDSYDWPVIRFWAGEAAGEATDSRENAYRVLAGMVRDAAEVIHSEDPGARVIGPSFTGGGGAEDFELFWSQDPAGLAGAVDAFSFHGYWEPEEEHEPEVTREMIQGYLDARSRLAWDHPPLAETPIWDTEGGWGMSFHAPCRQGRGPCIHDPDRQVAYLARWFLHHWDLGIANATWFHWGTNGWGELRCPEGTASEDHNVGCERLSTDEPGLTPAGVAYLTLVSWLHGATLAAPCEHDPPVWRCAIESSALPAGGLIVWSSEDETAPMFVDDAFSEVHALDGVVAAIADGEVEVGPKPVMVR